MDTLSRTLFIVNLMSIFYFWKGEGRNLNYLGSTMYAEDATVRLTQVASVLEGLKIIEKNIFKVENYEYVTYIYVGPDITGKEGEKEFFLCKRQVDLKKVVIPVQKSYVDPILFLPYLQKCNKTQK